MLNKSAHDLDFWRSLLLHRCHRSQMCDCPYTVQNVRAAPPTADDSHDAAKASRLPPTAGKVRVRRKNPPRNVVLMLKFSAAAQHRPSANSNASPALAPVS
jgi:hypothetical protein